MGKISLIDHVKNEEILYKVKEEMNVLPTVKRRLTGLVTSCVVSYKTLLKGRQS
jgi:hypothetical protein